MRCKLKAFNMNTNQNYSWKQIPTMNTLEQIVSQHPCPIIRAKIMENVNVPNYEKSSALSEIATLILHGINNWEDTKEGGEFWDAVYMDHQSTYSDLKYIDKSYTPEPTPHIPKWLPIDRDNLPKGLVAATQLGTEKVHAGRLYNDDYIYLEVDEITEIREITHYIPLSDLLNLPISE